MSTLQIEHLIPVISLLLLMLLATDALPAPTSESPHSVISDRRPIGGPAGLEKNDNDKSLRENTDSKDNNFIDELLLDELQLFEHERLEQSALEEQRLKRNSKFGERRRLPYDFIVM